DAKWSQDRCTGELVEDLIAFIYYLNVLGLSGITIGIGWRTAATAARESLAVKAKDGTGYIDCQTVQEFVLDDWVRPVVMVGGDHPNFASLQRRLRKPRERGG